MNDFRFALRALLRNPGFAAVAVLTLALGIGVNSALFSVVYELLLKPLPFPEPDRLVQVQTGMTAPGKSENVLAEWAYPCFELLRDQNRSFVQVAACANHEMTVSEGGDPQRIKVEQVACYLPARRAAKVDPLVALRCE